MGRSHALVAKLRVLEGANPRRPSRLSTGWRYAKGAITFLGVKVVISLQNA